MSDGGIIQSFAHRSPSRTTAPAPPDNQLSTVRRPATQILNPCEVPGWDATIDRAPRASVFHGSAWMRVLSDTYAYRPCSIIAKVEGAAMGVLPLMEVDSWLTGRRGISLPFTDECPALSATEGAAETLFETACEEGRRRRWRYIELRGGQPPRSGAPAATTYYSHELRLDRAERELFERIDPSGRRAIRKAQQGALTIEITRSIEGVNEFYALSRLTRRRLGVPPQPRAFFGNLQRLLLDRGHGFIVLARTEQRPVAAALFLHGNRSGLFKFGASDERYQHLRPNNLVMWEGIKALSALGCETLDLGRTSLSNEGLRRFKLSWGTEERMLNYFRYDCLADRWLTAPDRSSGRHSAIFQRLPLPISELIGALLYRHIA